MSPAPPCAIVGGGLGGFVAYTTLRYGGLEPDEIAVFGTDPDPAVDLPRPRGRDPAARDALGERRPLPGDARSPASPSGRRCGAAERPAARRLGLRPLPPDGRGVPRARRGGAGADAAGTRASVGGASSRSARSTEASSSTTQGVFPHVLLAPGHAGLAFPPGLEDDARVVHAYQPHEYADEVAVVGAGMAAATEWLNALAAGATVVSVRRREPARRPLNVERAATSRSAGSRGFRRTGRERARRAPARLRRALVPAGPDWDEPLAHAAAEGRFRVEPRAQRRGAGDLRDRLPPRLRRTTRCSPASCAEHGLETAEGWIVLATTRPSRR